MSKRGGDYSTNSCERTRYTYSLEGAVKILENRAKKAKQRAEARQRALNVGIRAVPKKPITLPSMPWDK